MRVYVVMGNDYPEAVFTSADVAQAFCEDKRAEDREQKAAGISRPPIYWRFYDFELLEKLPDLAPF